MKPEMTGSDDASAVGAVNDRDTVFDSPGLMTMLFGKIVTLAVALLSGTGPTEANMEPCLINQSTLKPNDNAAPYLLKGHGRTSSDMFQSVSDPLWSGISDHDGLAVRKSVAAQEIKRADDLR